MNGSEHGEAQGAVDSPVEGEAGPDAHRGCATTLGNAIAVFLLGSWAFDFAWRLWIRSPIDEIAFGLTGLPFAVIVSWWISPVFRRTTRNLGRKLSGKTTD